MEFFYYLVFGGFGAVVLVLELSKTNKDRINTSTAFNSFKNNYLVVYSLMMGNLSVLLFNCVISPTLLFIEVILDLDLSPQLFDDFVNCVNDDDFSSGSRVGIGSAFVSVSGD